MRKEAVIRWPSLGKRIILSLLIITSSCHQKNSSSAKSFSVIWQDGRAIKLSIAKRILSGLPEDSLRQQLQVRLAKPGKQPAILGNFLIQSEELIFEPLIPFTRGLRYQIWVKQQLIGAVEIPKAMAVPELRTIYPRQDTLPENLLKVYLVFSRPMAEGRSTQYITLTNHKGDTLPNSFLNLQPELWNTRSTVLTLWLDPGRIKRNLQPNKLLGSPLIKGEQYKLIISPGWPDKAGATLPQPYIKDFIVTVRDTVLPSVAAWKLRVPEKDTQQPLTVNLREPLDYSLLQNTIRLIDSRGNKVNGSLQMVAEEKMFHFKPNKPWSRGSYKLVIEARLEDLAGNNLNRLFDRDLQSPEATHTAREIFEKEWQIE